MQQNHKHYCLTQDATADLAKIAAYTVEKWGRQQAINYAAELEQTFSKLSLNQLPAKSFSKALPELKVWHHQHYYIFYLHQPTHAGITIIAVLHQRMDLLRQLADRLG